jgi:hypothetical protein
MKITKPTPAGAAFAVAALVIALALVPAALAGKPGGGSGGGGGGHKGGGGGSSSLTLTMVADENSNGLPNWNDTITFNVSTTATTQPYVEVTCSQNGAVVYSAWAGFYSSYPWPGSQLMPLYSPSWTGGAADCTAVLDPNLATLNFHVGA